MSTETKPLTAFPIDVLPPDRRAHIEDSLRESIQWECELSLMALSEHFRAGRVERGFVLVDGALLDKAKADIEAQAREIAELREALAERDAQWVAMPSQWRRQIRNRVASLEAGEEVEAWPDA